MKEGIAIKILKLAPACKNYLWGGRRLIENYNINYTGKILAEAWMLSAHQDGASIITNGIYAGKNFREYLAAEGLKVLGTNCRMKDFPILIKFIDAQDNLSVQVHPSDDYAQKFENQFGKSEFVERVNSGTLEEILQKIFVHKGDCFFIPAGTIHSVGKGILLAEIQQNSNVSYRIYDYNRRGADGKFRELHVDKALDVANLKPFVDDKKNYPHLVTCDYFTVDKINLDGKIFTRLEGKVTAESFMSILILDGRGKIFVGNKTLTYAKGDSFFIPADAGDWAIEGIVDALITTN